MDSLHQVSTIPQCWRCAGSSAIAPIRFTCPCRLLSNWKVLFPLAECRPGQVDCQGVNFEPLVKEHTLPNIVSEMKSDLCIS